MMQYCMCLGEGPAHTGILEPSANLKYVCWTRKTCYLAPKIYFSEIEHKDRFSDLENKE